MAMFAMEISFLVALSVFAAGLVLVHQARQANAGLLRAAGALLLVGSAATAACTLYYGVRYHVQGDFESAYAMPMMGRGWMRGPGGWMGPQMMGPGWEGMGPQMMGRGGPGPGGGPGPMHPWGWRGPMMGGPGGPATPTPAEPPSEEPKPGAK
jgi:hypothetical protein